MEYTETLNMYVATPLERIISRFLWLYARLQTKRAISKEWHAICPKLGKWLVLW